MSKAYNKRHEIVATDLTEEEMETILIKMGVSIRTLRKGKDWSLRDMALATNIDNSKLGKIEKGRINITVIMLTKIALGLGVNAADLLKP